MATSSFPRLESCSKLNEDECEESLLSISVSHSEGSSRPRKEKHVNHLPAIKTLQETGLKTLKKTQVVQKQAELDEVDIELAVKRQQFQNHLEALALRRSELESKQQQAREKTIKFEKFVSENEAKRREALKRCEATRQQNILKQRAIEELTEQLKQIRTRKHRLKEKTEKYKIYEDFLMKTLDHLPRIFRDSGYESSGTAIIRRHEILSATHQKLQQHLAGMEEELEQGKRQLQTMKQENSVRKLLANKELSELQNELETLKEKNKQVEFDLFMQQDVSREKTKETGNLLLAIDNLAQLCYLPAYGPLEKMDVLTMMDMVKEYILDKADTERRARQTMEHNLTATSTAALTHKNEKGLMKNTESKTLLKSSSKVSKQSDI